MQTCILESHSFLRHHCASKLSIVGFISLRHRLNYFCSQVYKSTADYNGGKALYDKYSAVDDEFLVLRKTVLARKTPRRLFVQAHTSSGGKEMMCFGLLARILLALNKV